ncbi:aromatic acid exporter family protein [Anaerobacillus alkaliphilus]
MFKIGYRTIKTAIGAAIAIGIAQGLGLTFYASAGIIAILCVQKTRRKSLKLSWERLLACSVGMLYAIVAFELIGYNPLAVGLLLLTFIPTVVILKAKEGIATSSVIILHLYALGEVSPSIVLNEYALIIIGIGVALLVNFYMPSVEKELGEIQSEIENNFKEIFLQFATYLKQGDSNWDGKQITVTADLLSRGKDVALQNIENHLLRYEDKYYHYFKMREKQFEIIERVMPLISSLDHTVIQGEKIAEFLEELSRGVRPEISPIDFLEKLNELRLEFRKMELPKDRDEFETRSILYAFVKEVEQYLIIKRHFRIEKA